MTGFERLESEVTTLPTEPQPRHQKIWFFQFQSVDKIYAGDRFCAYIVIPMFPEGDPTSAPILEILVSHGALV